MPPNAAVLMIGIAADRAYPADRVAFMKKVRSYDSPICFGHHSPREGGANESLHQALGELEGRETAPEPVMIIDAAKGLKADPGALLGVFGRYLSKSHRLFHG